MRLQNGEENWNGSQATANKLNGHRVMYWIKRSIPCQRNYTRRWSVSSIMRCGTS
jgi:hypothetical protein